MDRAGRLVVPRDIRARLGLRAGGRLRIVEDDRRIILAPEEEEAPIREKAGLLVFVGSLAAEVPDHRRLRDDALARLTRP